MTNVSQEDGNIYYEMLTYPKGVTTLYRLASRSNAISGSYAYFQMQYVGGGGVIQSHMFNYQGVEWESSYPIRPIVSIPSTMIDITVGDGLSANTAFGI